MALLGPAYMGLLNVRASTVEQMAQINHEAEQAAYSTAKGRLSELKAARIPAVVPLPRVPKASEIRLSKFSGSYTEWAGWHAEFQAKVSYSHSFSMHVNGTRV